MNQEQIASIIYLVSSAIGEFDALNISYRWNRITDLTININENWVQFEHILRVFELRGLVELTGKDVTGMSQYRFKKILTWGHLRSLEEEINIVEPYITN